MTEKDFLESEEFYNAMQRYRISSMDDQRNVIANFENVKNKVRENFVARPRQPKMKTITLRKALLKTTTKDYWIIEGTCNYEAGNDFVCWLGEPYTVEVPA